MQSEPEPEPELAPELPVDVLLPDASREQQQALLHEAPAEKTSMFSGFGGMRLRLEQTKAAAEEAVWAKAAEAQAQAAIAAAGARAKVAEVEAAAYAQAAAAQKAWAGEQQPSKESWEKLRLAVASDRAVHTERRFEGAAMQGEMDREGGYVSKWTALYVVLLDGELLAFNSRTDSKPIFRLGVAECAVRRPLSERKGRPHVLRIDSTDDSVEKLVLDARSAVALDEWMVALGNAGAVVPAAFICKLDSGAAAAQPYSSTPRRRRIKKGWLSIQPSSWWRLKHPMISEWQLYWLQFDMPTLTVHQRPGGEALATVEMDLFELQLGPGVEESLGRDFSFRTLERAYLLRAIH